jgi:hypothetical protein
VPCVQAKALARIRSLPKGVAQPVTLGRLILLGVFGRDLDPEFLAESQNVMAIILIEFIT